MEEFISPEEEIEQDVTDAALSSLFSDDVPGDDVTVTETEALTLSISDYSKIMLSSIPVGVLSGAIFMIIGFTVLGIVKIIKNSL